jgi:hypothetical protein
MTAQWILNDIWGEGYGDARGNHGEANVYTHADEAKAYDEGYSAGLRARWEAQAKEEKEAAQ